MQMIAALAESNKLANDRMEQQIHLITNLLQTVADLVIRVSDQDSDASTITSNEQCKRRITHQPSKSSMRRLHPSNAGSTGQMNIPPDPGEIHRYIEFPTLESQDEESPMHQEEVHDEVQSTAQRHPGHNTMSQDDQAHVDSECTEHTDADTAMPDNAKANNTHIALEVNGGINDDDLLDMMASDAEAMHTTTTTDASPEGPVGDREEQC